MALDVKGRAGIHRACVEAPAGLCLVCDPQHERQQLASESEEHRLGNNCANLKKKATEN